MGRTGGLPAACQPVCSILTSAAADAYDQAKAICARCQVRAECASAGQLETYGARGGRSPAERMADRPKTAA